MTTSTIDLAQSSAIAVRISDDALGVSLADGREISVPLDWFPRLQHATPWERQDWRLLDCGRGIRWDAIDEDISIAGPAGRPALRRKPGIFRPLARGATSSGRRAGRRRIG